MPFDPDAAGRPGSGIFGLTCSREDSRIILTPVPFDATTSYGGGAGAGAEAIRRASMQVDLYDLRLGRVYEAGISMDEPDPRIAAASARARALAAPIIEKGGADAADAEAVAGIDAAGTLVNEIVHQRTLAVLREGKIPGLVGGDHSTPLGAIRACAEHAGPIGILHLDAHLDLRDAFEGMAWSHASIMHNVLRSVPRVAHMTQIGIRDFGEGELAAARAAGDRVAVHFDQDWADALARGAKYLDLVRAALRPLPPKVYVSFDIDALDPSLCPHTGTPVPGGLTFPQAALILHELAASGRQVVGFDLVEVCPGPSATGGTPVPHEPEWDANVGARILYKLCGAAAAYGRGSAT
ncbi:MAG: arginase family protein [Phycisphaerales bacterium]|nr:arginase family protein [Phycisphaerales bacterium]